MSQTFSSGGGACARAVAVPARSSWLAVTATPVLADNGTVPLDAADQAAATWANLERALTTAGFMREDLVSVTQYVTDADAVPWFEQARADALGDLRLACTLLVVSGLAEPRHKVRIEAWAARTGHPTLDNQEWQREARRTTDLGYRDTDEADAYERAAHEVRT